MKQIMLVLLAMMVLSDNKLQGSHLSSIRDVSKRGETATYYYAYYGESIRQAGWSCWEFTCDRNGNILKKGSIGLDAIRHLKSLGNT